MTRRQRRNGGRDLWDRLHARAGYGRIILLVLVLAFSWGETSLAQTPADAQYESPTATSSGNPAAFGNGSDPTSGGNAGEGTVGGDTADGDPGGADFGGMGFTGDEPAGMSSPGGDAGYLLGIGLGFLGAIADLYAAAYLWFRVRPGLSLMLQRRILVFLVLIGLLFATSQLLYALTSLLTPGDGLSLYFEAAHFASGVGAAVCMIAAGRLLRRSELDEVGPLRRSADFDTLTALHNQSFFRRAAQRRIAQAARHGVPLSLAMLDVDDFKSYNDHFGHEAGNAVLRRLAGVLRQSVRADDLVARYGGEEFVMLMNSGPEEAHEALERIRNRIEEWCSPGDSLLLRQVTVSIGVATLTDGPRQSLEDLVEAADDAMYQAKRAGKNRVVALGETA